jgi:Tol biopolymer transport system component
MKNIIALIILILISVNIKCSNDGISDSWKYVGQPPPGKTAQLFAPDIIQHLAHSSPTFSPNGKEIYWSTTSENNETRKIYYVKYENNRWSEPNVAPFSGKYHDDQPFISHDGNKLYFASKRPKVIDGNQENDIWISTKIEHGWGEPTPIDNFIGFWTPSVTKEGAIYFLDIKSGYKRSCGIFRAEFKNGKYSTPEFLPEQINQKDAQDWCPFISPDESYLIFSSDREGGFGAGDLYICFREKSGKWSEPINMGTSINSEKQERFPGVSPDGKYLFVTRWFGPPNLHDLYWIDASIIKDLKKRP